MIRNTFEGGYTGRMFEDDFLPRLSDDWRNEGYFDEARSFQWVRDHQEWDPSDPSIKTSNELHYKVAEKLGLDDNNDLKLYSALNSPLDYHFGIDAFFEWGDANFTLDFSTNPNKDMAKADMVVHEKDLLNEKELDTLATTISNFLKQRGVGGARPVRRAA